MNNELEKVPDLLSSLIIGDDNPDAQLLMARVFHRQGAMEIAVTLVEKVVNYQVDHAEAFGLLALLYFDLNEEELALQASVQALELDPGNYDALLVNVLSRLSTQETTVAEIEDLLQMNPQDSRLWFALGTTYMTEGNLIEAENALQKAVEIYPDFYDCYTVLAWTQLLNNKIDEAQTCYQTIAQLVPELADAWGGLALVAALKEDFLTAEQFIKQAKKLNPECFLTEIAQTIYFSHLQPAQAKQHLVKALKNSKVSISEKLAFIIEDITEPQQLH